MRARTRTAAAVAAAALLTTACASSDPFGDPLFWEGVSLAADLTALAIIMDSDCYTRIDSYGYAHRVCRTPAPPPHRPPHRRRHR